MPLVSVIMGVYNCKRKSLLELSVDSVLKQTFDDFEFIICNDGSTDDTQLYLDSIAKKDKRIKIISYSKNKGLNYALNECIKSSRGKYIARQDDDDISYNTRFEKEVDYLEKHPEYAIVGTIADVYDDNGIWGKYDVPEKPETRDFLWISPFIHPSVIMRKECLEKVCCYRIAKETRRCEDYDLFMRMYAAGYKGYNIQEKLYRYWLDNNPNKKLRPMKYRIDEAVVRYKGYRKLGITAQGVPYVLKPLIIGMIPQKLLYLIKKSQY